MHKELAPLLPAEEACRLLDCDPSTLRRWERAGYIRLVRIGRRKYVPADEIVRIAQGGAPEKGTQDG